MIHKIGILNTYPGGPIAPIIPSLIYNPAQTFDGRGSPYLNVTTRLLDVNDCFCHMNCLKFIKILKIGTDYG